jgi:predicted alpha/beta-fold hydrolase
MPLMLHKCLDERAAPWLPGGHLQTIWPAVSARSGLQSPAAPPFVRERWRAPDGDFIDVDWQRSGGTTTRLLVLFHGLEGSSKSHYAQAFAHYARSHDLDFAVPHFRGCSGENNLAPRAYHSGDHEEIAWILQQVRQQTTRAVLAVGVSLGGNALLRWAQEAGSTAKHTVAALAAVSAPVDLQASGLCMGQGFNKQVYSRMFLTSMKAKALQKLSQFPGLFDAQALHAAKTLYDFDNVVTAPLHGFKNTLDYWQRASAKPGLARIQVPTLLLNARNDPFVPAHSLPQPNQVGRHVRLCQPKWGGHVGFVQGWPPGHVRGLPQAVGEWLTAQGDGHG